MTSKPNKPPRTPQTTPETKTSNPSQPPRAPQTAPEQPSEQAPTRKGQFFDGLERITRRLQVGRPSNTGSSPSQRPVPRETIDMLIAALGDTSHPRHASAVNELVGIGAPAVPAICTALQDQHSWLVVYRAAEAAGQIGDGRASGPLIQALRHPNSNVRWGAVRALTQAGDLRAVIELQRVAQNDAGRTSWGESVADAAQSALDQLRRNSVWSQSYELVKTAITSILMILALVLAFSVLTTLRDELDRFGQVVPGQNQIPSFNLPTVVPTTGVPTAAPAPTLSLPTAVPESASEAPALAPAGLPSTVTQLSNVRPLPSTDNEPIGRVNQGDQVILLAQSANGQWYRVRLGEEYAGDSAINNPDGSETGWINQALVTPPQGELPVEDPLSSEVPPATSP